MAERRNIMSEWGLYKVTELRITKTCLAFLVLSKGNTSLELYAAPVGRMADPYRPQPCKDEYFFYFLG
jgi:hypothetical protein